MSPLEAALRGLANDMGPNSGAGVSKISQDMQARVLRDALLLVKRENPFKVGDLIVQQKERKRYSFAESDICIVTDVLKSRPPFSTGADDETVGNNDIFIMTIMQKTLIQFMVESWRFKKYTGGVA